jgi:complement component 2
MEANMALRKPQGSTCQDHGECWVWEELGPGLGAVLKPDNWILGKETCTDILFSLMAERELLNQQSIPAHFVALNGSKLNINLKTGPQVRVSG